MDKNEAAAALGRLGGSANTAAQNEARRTNGAKGGRPRAVWTIEKQITRQAYARNGNVGNATQYASWIVLKDGRFNTRFHTKREAAAYVATKGATR